jgi:hypothetical protein
MKDWVNSSECAFQHPCVIVLYVFPWTHVPKAIPTQCACAQPHLAICLCSSIHSMQRRNFAKVIIFTLPNFRHGSTICSKEPGTMY